MKNWATLLLLIVTMAASFSSCCSVDDCCDEVQTSQNTSQGDRESEDNCSPFINCGTCPGFTQMENVADIPTIQNVKQVHYSKLVSLTLSNYTASLLQPPRVA